MRKLKLKNGAIRRLREQKSWSQEDLAHKSGDSIRTVQRAEGGESPNPNNLACIAQALEVEPADLLSQSAAETVTSAPASPIPVVLHLVSDGNELVKCVAGSLALHSDVRAVSDHEDAEAIGTMLDELRDYLDIGGEMSFADQLRYGVDLTSEISALKNRGWWVFAGTKRHKLCSPTLASPVPWVTCVVIVTRPDDTIVEHRQDGEAVAFVHLPGQVSFR